jgi:hypothetical protein
MKNIPDLEVSITPIDFGADGITFKLTKEQCKYLGLKKSSKELYVIPTNSVIQLSSKPALASIPVLTEENLEFQEQDKD